MYFFYGEKGRVLYNGGTIFILGERSGIILVQRKGKKGVAKEVLFLIGPWMEWVGEYTLNGWEGRIFPFCKRSAVSAICNSRCHFEQHSNVVL